MAQDNVSTTANLRRLLPELWFTAETGKPEIRDPRQTVRRKQPYCVGPARGAGRCQSFVCGLPCIDRQDPSADNVHDSRREWRTQQAQIPSTLEPGIACEEQQQGECSQCTPRRIARRRCAVVLWQQEHRSSVRIGEVISIMPAFCSEPTFQPSFLHLLNIARGDSSSEYSAARDRTSVARASALALVASECPPGTF